MIKEICDNCKHSEATECLGYLECNKNLELGNVVYFTDKACDGWEARSSET